MVYNSLDLDRPDDLLCEIDGTKGSAGRWRCALTGRFAYILLNVGNDPSRMLRVRRTEAMQLCGRAGRDRFKVVKNGNFLSPCPEKNSLFIKCIKKCCDFGVFFSPILLLFLKK